VQQKNDLIFCRWHNCWTYSRETIFLANQKSQFMKKLLLGLAVVLPAAMVLATKDVQKATTSKVNGHSYVYKVTDTIPKDTSKKDTARLR
jgi:hypothetical protein